MRRQGNTSSAARAWRGAGYALTRQGEASGMTHLAQARELARALGLNGLLRLAEADELAALAERDERETFETRAQDFLAKAAAGPGRKELQHAVARLRALLLLRQGNPAEALPLSLRRRNGIATINTAGWNSSAWNSRRRR